MHISQGSTAHLQVLKLIIHTTVILQKYSNTWFFPQKKTTSWSPTVNMTPTHFPPQALSKEVFSSSSLANNTLIIKVSFSF